jgi:restriction system protein
MSTSHLVLIAVVVALALGAAATLALRSGGRRRMEAAAGIRALAAMRWREFSQFVVTALQAQGFEAASLSDNAAGSRDSADVLLRRDQRTWLLTCRQSPAYRVTEKHVEEMGHAVRQRGAAGGVIATLGRIAPGVARTTERVELVDGPALWELIEPLLPAGLQDHVAEQVQQRQRRALLGAWLAALGLGIVVAFALSRFGDADALSPAPAPTAPASAAPNGSVVAPPRTPGAPAPDAAVPVETITGDDEATRQAVLEAVNAIEGVNRSVWSTRSTLLVLLESDGANVRTDLCAVLERYEALRASRVQLQPPQGSALPVRFMQCRAY